MKDIKQKLDKVFGKDSLSMSQVYRILAPVRSREYLGDGGHDNVKMKTRTTDLIMAMNAEVTSDRRVMVSVLADKFEVSERMILRVLHDDLGLSKKSARWVPRLLSDAQ